MHFYIIVTTISCSIMITTIRGCTASCLDGSLCFGVQGRGV